MSGWHYPEDNTWAPWDGPQYEPDRPSLADVTDPEEEFWNEKRHYPRGRGPAWHGEDAPSDSGAGHIWTDDEEPDHAWWGDDRLIRDPGFKEGKMTDYDPNRELTHEELDAENRWWVEHEKDRPPVGAGNELSDEELQAKWGTPKHEKSGGIQTQVDQYPLAPHIPEG